MSASREKKIRQDLAAQGVTDPKKIREAEEKAKARKNNILVRRDRRRVRDRGRGTAGV